MYLTSRVVILVFKELQNPDIGPRRASRSHKLRLAETRGEPAGKVANDAGVQHSFVRLDAGLERIFLETLGEEAPLETTSTKSAPN